MRKKSVKRLTPLQAGIAGEYLVAAELTRRGFVASLTLRNTRGMDILASNRDATRSVGIQVKTSQSGRPAWMLNKKAETDLAENLFYVFVCIPAGEPPSYHIVPRNIVGLYVRQTHQDWLKVTGRGGRPHKDSDMRQFKDPEGRYKEAWHTLGLDDTSGS